MGVDSFKSALAACRVTYTYASARDPQRRREFAHEADVVFSVCTAFCRRDARVGWRVGEALRRCRDHALDAKVMRHPERRVAALHSACDALYAASAISPKSFSRFLFSLSHREL